jgi:hypothetical protein
MSINFDQKSILAAFSVVVSLTAGFLLRDVKKFTKGRIQGQNEQERLIEKEERLIEKEERLNEKEATLKSREESLDCREQALESKHGALEKRERDAANKDQELKALGAHLDNREATIAAKEVQMLKVEDGLILTDRDEEELAEPAFVEAETIETVDDEHPQVEPEKEKRLRMIDEELKKIVKLVEDEELGEEMEPEALEALEKAAVVVCFRKKYYDVMRDELIYFPSVSKAIVNGDLVEEAEKYYYDEEDEFPMLYSAAMRAIVAASMSEDDADLDEEYMSKLALDVEI